MAKKGQAAIEFLMTYGWAILAAIVVIGVLAYFGVFSPSSYVPNQCVISAPFGCNAGSVSTDNVVLEVRNGAGETLNISEVTVEGCGSYSTATSVSDGSLTTITVPCSTALTADSKFKGGITITYNKQGSALSLTSTGQIVDKV